MKPNWCEAWGGRWSLHYDEKERSFDRKSALPQELIVGERDTSSRGEKKNKEEKEVSIKQDGIFSSCRLEADKAKARAETSYRRPSWSL